MMLLMTKSTLGRISLFLALLLKAGVGVRSLKPSPPPPPPSLSILKSRRGAFRQAAAGLTTSAGWLVAGSGGGVAAEPANAAAPGFDAGEDDGTISSLRAFRVIPDASASLSPKLRSISPSDFAREIKYLRKSSGGALWLGEHHNSASDHVLQAKILRAIHREEKQAPLAVGLEQVQVKFQPVLDEFNRGSISMREMRERVEWDKRWMWPFENYEPVFAAAKELGVPLIALNVNSEDMSLVEKSGLPGLPRDQLQQYIPDAMGFANFAKRTDFGPYVDYVIAPSYDLHQAMGLLKYTMSGERLDQEMPFRNFLSGRLLWDETMASRAFAWTQSNPRGLLVGLVGADHVKYQNGIPARYARMVTTNEQQQKSQSSPSTSRKSVTVMLNPTLIDTRPSGSVADVQFSDSALYPDRLTLQLRYLKAGTDPSNRGLPSSTAGVLPLADYIVTG